MRPRGLIAKSQMEKVRRRKSAPNRKLRFALYDEAEMRWAERLYGGPTLDRKIANRESAMGKNATDGKCDEENAMGRKCDGLIHRIANICDGLVEHKK